jgi:adenine-specific DNA-methyltransferase
LETLIKKESEELSNLTIEYLKNRPKEERSPLGQFITPKSLRDALLDQIELSPGMKVLDPGVGTGEFLYSCNARVDNLSLEGWDIDPQVVEIAKKLVPNAQIKIQSALDQSWDQNFDVVIGNPPYFEMRNLDAKTKQSYKQVIGGRPNIFSLFFAAGLGALKAGGVLGYVVPPSMNNGAFFTKLRSYISQSASIEFLKVYTDSDLFLDAQTAVQLIVLRKGKTSSKHIIDLGKLAKTTEQRQIFVENTASFKNEFMDRTNLWNLGYKATTGSLVWNKNKNKLKNFPEKETVPLIWAHNITSESNIVIDEQHPKKPQYVLSKEFLVGPAIVVNRITGSVGQGSLRCALIPEGFKYIGENHVNIITKRKDMTPLIKLEEVLKLLRKTGINEKVQKLTGNTQISCVELTHFLPLDIKIDQLEESTLF